jgi:transcriptional regulator with XRE-family HTH domain
MTSPYVRRLRLGIELQALRDERNWTQARAARMIGKSRQEISKMERGLSANPTDVLNLLEALGVEDERWTELTAIARDAAQPGWWDSLKDIGERQSLYADLESGAATIRKYEMTALPGVLQIPDYTRSISMANAAIEPLSGTIDGILAGRAGRQRNLRRPGAPVVELIVDEFAVLRRAAPADVVKRQLRHLAEVVKGGQPNVTLRVLPAEAQFRDFVVPRGTFSLYTYPDARDPRVVAIDTVTSDVILFSEAEVATYERIWEHSREAALPPEESAKFLTEAADALPDRLTSVVPGGVDGP